MRFILTLIIILGIVDRFEGYVIVKVDIFNYRNDYNLKHDGFNCENFHFLGDHCDPVFHICIGSYSKCDLVNKRIGSWHNHKRISNVLSESIRLIDLPDSISISVSVDDHDSFDDNDHIAKFSALFQIDRNSNVYEKVMSVQPYNFGVGLDSKIILECFDNLHETNCQERYKLKQCRRYCRKGECKTQYLDEFFCQCIPGWSGEYCHENFVGTCENLRCNKKCTRYYVVMECICTESDLYRIYCRETIKVKPETIPKLLDPSTHSPRPETTPKPSEATVSTTVSTKIKSTNYLITKISKNYTSSTESSGFKNKTKRLYSKYITKRRLSTPETNELISLSNVISNMSRQHSQSLSDTIQKLIDDKIIKTHHSPSTIIIICILILLCISILALILVVQKGQKRRISKLDNRRPLPPIVFQRDNNNIRQFNNNSTKLKKIDDDYYDSCTIGQKIDEEVDSKLFNNHNDRNHIFDIYEASLINHMESLTYETEYNDSVNGDMYEVPVKHNLPIN